MSNDPVSVRLSDRDRERIEAFAEDEGTNNSQAIQKALSRGLEIYGYGTADEWIGDPPIKRVTQQGTLVAVSMAASLSGVHLATTLSMLGPMTVFLALALVLLVVRSVEPRVSTMLFRGGEDA